MHRTSETGVVFVQVTINSAFHNIILYDCKTHLSLLCYSKTLLYTMYIFG